MEVTAGSTSKYKKYNDSVSGPESRGSYTIVNNTKTVTIDGKKKKVIKPVEQWAIGRYQHYYKYQKGKIIAALKARGIDTEGLSKDKIALAYSNSPEAQEIVQALINDINFKAAENQISKHGLKASVEEIAFLNHYLGNAGAERYLSYLDKYGYDEAGQAKADYEMAYGPKGIGGPDSSNPNAFVSKHIAKFKAANT